MATDDFFRARIDQMIDLGHPLAVLAQRLPWTELEAALAPVFARKPKQPVADGSVDLFGPVPAGGAYVSNAGRPRLPLRLMISLLYLKHAFGLSDEEVVCRWSENIVWQYFWGTEYYDEPRLPCDTVQISRFRSTIGESGVEELLAATPPRAHGCTAANRYPGTTGAVVRLRSSVAHKRCVLRRRMSRSAF